MLKKTITYTDFNGDEVSEDFFFHLSQAELVELEMSFDGGLSETMKRVIAENDGKTIIEVFKRILLMSYGKRSPDGKRFIKNQTLREEFESSEAYSTLFMELVTDPDNAASEFVNGIIPGNLVEERMKVGGADLKSVPDMVPEVKKMRLSEFNALSHDEQLELIGPLSRNEMRIVPDEQPVA